MIYRVRANQSSFRSVEFTDGFNVVLADRTKESTKKDSRNGLGKSTLIEIIHFCLGAGTRTGKGLQVKALKDWCFFLDLDVGGRRVTVQRSVDHPSKVEVHGEVLDWSNKSSDGGRLSIPIKEWTAILGQAQFGLPRIPEDGYVPTYRSLISYMIRRGRDAFATPFEHHRKQREWDKQINNAFLLGLAWKYARAWQELKDQAGVLDTLKKAVTSNLMEGMIGSLGELEAEKVRLQEVALGQGERLRSFKVLPEYRQVETRASELTRAIHTLVNQNVSSRHVLGFYRDSLADIETPETAQIMDLYGQAGVQLAGMVVRRLDEVQNFHRQLIRNRREFLAAEIERIEAVIEERDEAIREHSAERSELLTILKEHGALDEYTRLQQLHLKTSAQVRDLETRIRNLRKFEKGRSSLKIDRERLYQKARRDHDERRSIWERAISLFNSHSQALYQAPGRLLIDIGDSGFSFGVDIERSGSAGFESMKIFCYDLMLAQLWAEEDPSPRLLIHDSSLFDGVDQRQVALALERASVLASESRFQYICTLNSDTLPDDEFSKDFNIEPFVRLRLTDATPAGSLLGIRY